MTVLDVPVISTVELTSSRASPLLVVGPSLGTSVRELWGEVAALLTDQFHVLGWELPGHGTNRSVSEHAVSMASIAQGVVTAVDRFLAVNGLAHPRFAYAGDSVGGAVGLHLLLEHRPRISGAILACTGARLGDTASWRERAHLVAGQGTEVVVEGSLQRWFGPGFTQRRPDITDTFTRRLLEVDPVGYAQVCHALAGFDVTDRLAEIAAPVLAIAGDQDRPTPVPLLREIAEGVQDGHLAVLPGVGHLAPVEAPESVADLAIVHLSA
ncbi:alpha/beta fold hydrolase [Knoellia koreensis]|jgi:3-oxoadipate enol-lactonase / 4-carboxymuconolactone decarboxylase|uniref:Alpha/beta fold hydrolase n=1 Tax=Knoellia koreensis TaxID=2730921 RepID=A0A849HMJ8_9MICO|nr:alpha/beta fold hydrolase [Knoellia sp. DB2414S]NNM48319.1 alpha/beta fold hydrolase [Knoellia sp. DB2414S]